MLSWLINARLMQTKMRLGSLVRPVSDKTGKKHCATMELVHKPGSAVLMILRPAAMMRLQP